MSSKNMLLSEVFKEASEKLKKAGCNFTEAEVVYLWKLAWYNSGGSTSYFEPSKESLKLFTLLIEKRASGIPTPLIEGKVDFGGIEVLVEPGVFIPRPETEELARLALERARDSDRNLKILDVGTGSGAIAVYLAYNLPHAEVCAIDINTRAVLLARKNAQFYGLKNLEVFKISFSNLTEKGKRYDLIVSNPPYISEKEMFSLPREVVSWEPEESLFAGEDGLEFFREFAARVSYIYNFHGVCLLEFGDGQGEKVKEIFEKNGYKVTIHRDINGKERFAEVRKT